MVFPPVCRSYKRPAYIHAVHRMCPMATTHGSSLWKQHIFKLYWQFKPLVTASKLIFFSIKNYL
jgi:hypothetical protein